VFQSYNLVPQMTVWENVCLPFTLRRQRPPRQAVRDVLDRFGLGRRRKATPATLSGGEQQRVALARVLVSEPTLVFADEPTGALDQESGHVVIEALRKVADDPSRAVVLVTHSEAVASSCDRLVELVDGRITQTSGRREPV
jgi:putative ABC transport system ATP-binding protein